jgi:hypothetical protein
MKCPNLFLQERKAFVKAIIRRWLNIMDLSIKFLVNLSKICSLILTQKSPKAVKPMEKFQRINRRINYIPLSIAKEKYVNIEFAVNATKK